MIPQIINELIADLATPAALRAVPTLNELAKFDELSSDKDQIRHMVNLLDALFEDDQCYFSLVGSNLRNYAMNEVCRALHVLESMLDGYQIEQDDTPE